MTSPSVPPPRFDVSLTSTQWAVVCEALEEYVENVCDGMPEESTTNATLDEVQAQLRAQGVKWGQGGP